MSALNGWGKSFGPCSPSKAVLTESMSVSLQPVILGQLTMGPGGWVAAVDTAESNQQPSGVKTLLWPEECGRASEPQSNPLLGSARLGS